MATETDVYALEVQVKGDAKVEALAKQWSAMAAAVVAAKPPLDNLTSAIDLNEEALTALYGEVVKDTAGIIAFAEAQTKAAGKTYELADAERFAAQQAALRTEAIKREAAAALEWADAQAAAAVKSRAAGFSAPIPWNAAGQGGGGGINLSSLKTDLSLVDRGAAAASRSIEQVGGAAQQAGQRGAMGIMLLSQTIDDAQYGFKSIVNNIPMLGSALGQSLGMGTEKAMAFGGALGLLAVAVNLNINNMDAWKSVLRDIDGGGGGVLTSIKEQAWGVADALNGLVQYASGGNLSFSMRATADIAKVRAQEAAEAKGAAAAGASVSGMTTKEEQGRGKAFKDAIEGTDGGGRALRDRLLNNALSGRSQEDLDREVRLPSGGTEKLRDRIARGIDLGLKAALEGNATQIDAFIEQLGPEFKARYDEHKPEAIQAAKDLAKEISDDEQWQKGQLDKRRAAGEKAKREMEAFRRHQESEQSTARQKVEHEAQQKAHQAEAAAKHEADRHAGALDDLFAPALGRQMTTGFMSGRGGPDVDKGLVNQVERELKRTARANGVPAAQRRRVAEEIVRGQREKFNIQATAFAMNGGLTDVAAPKRRPRKMTETEKKNADARKARDARLKAVRAATVARRKQAALMRNPRGGMVLNPRGHGADNPDDVLSPEARAGKQLAAMQAARKGLGGAAPVFTDAMMNAKFEGFNGAAAAAAVAPPLAQGMGTLVRGQQAIATTITNVVNACGQLQSKVEHVINSMERVNRSLTTNQRGNFPGVR